MDIANSKTLSTQKIDQAVSRTSTATQSQTSVTFSDELKNVSDVKTSEKEEVSIEKTESELKNSKTDTKESTFEIKDDLIQEQDLNPLKIEEQPKIIEQSNGVTEAVPIENRELSQNQENDNKLDMAYTGLNNIVEELSKINQKEEMSADTVKQMSVDDDKNDIVDNVNFDKNKQITNVNINQELIEDDKNEDFELIDNNMNIQEPKEKINMQMGSNTNFTGDGQPFAEFVNQTKADDKLSLNVKDLKEEQEIMSTMEENIAIANKNMAMAKSKSATEKSEPIVKEEVEIKETPKTKTVENDRGVYKVSEKTNLVVDTVVSYQNVIMDKADVEFFTNLVENGFVDMKEVAAPEKSSQVSKTLADMLAKAMNENKPVRIDFDNNISIIIKIDRAGKISADFLPSSQVAEAYLKENLPLLRQRFDDNNIDYNELNQRQRKQDTQDNKKKGRKDE